MGATASGQGEQLIEAQLPRLVAEKLSSSRPEPERGAAEEEETETVVGDAVRSFVARASGERFAGLLVLRQQEGEAAEPAADGEAGGEGGAAAAAPAGGGSLFEVAWSHSTSSFGVAFLSAKMARAGEAPRCVFSRLRPELHAAEVPGAAVCTMGAVTA